MTERTKAFLSPKILEFQRFVSAQVDHEKWRALLYAISFLHSIVQERRKFGAIGWCVPYEFNNSDLDASLLFLEKHLSSTIMAPRFFGKMCAILLLDMEWEV